jgi:hypothetical protein
MVYSLSNLSFLELAITAGPGGPSQRRRSTGFAASLRLKNVQLGWSQLHVEGDTLDREGKC